MRKSEFLVRMLCLPYCTHYKEGANEDLLCRGAAVVERLMLSGRSLLLQEQESRPHDTVSRELLIQHLCRTCDFRENDCDFARDRASPPCGGFVLLGGLVEQGVITIDDIQGTNTPQPPAARKRGHNPR